MELQKRNNVIIKGNGENVLLFAHGYGCDQNMWRFVYPEFQDDYRIVLFDHVGSGKSDWNAYNQQKYSNLQGYADDIIEICENFHLEKVILVAHSVSAMIALLAAKKNPSLFNNIIMIGPSPRYLNDTDYYGGFSEKDILEMVDTLDSNYLGWSSAITPVIMGNPDKPELAKELENSFCQHDPAIAKHFARVTFLGDNRKDLLELKTPTLVLQCSKDIIAPMQVGEYVHKNIPNSELIVLEATGHCPHMTHPKETIEIIKKYLASIE
jgi:sigma-B regulation protein RsbQ